MSDFYQKKFYKGSVWFAAPTTSTRHPFYFIVRRNRPLDMQLAVYYFDDDRLIENIYMNYDDIAQNYVTTLIGG